MKILLYIIFIISTIVSSGIAQRNITTSAGQKIKIMADNTWTVLPSTDNNDVKTADEMPYPSYMNEGIINDIKMIRSAADKKEVEMFLLLDFLEKELDVKKLQLSYSKKMKNKENEKKLSIEINDAKQRVILAEKDYTSASQNVIKSKSLVTKNKTELPGHMSELAAVLGLKQTYLTTSKSKNITESSRINMISKEMEKSTFESKCNILSNTSNGKIRYVEMQSENLFNFTPQKLKSYFKEKELMQTDIAVISENKVKKLRLTQKLISKDAAKNYGYVPLEGLLRITLITGKKIDLYAAKSSVGELELFSGNVIYETDYHLTEDALGGLENAPIDTFGMMWSSGFETYTVYKVDVIMNQLACIQKVLK